MSKSTAFVSGYGQFGGVVRGSGIAVCQLICCFVFRLTLFPPFSRLNLRLSPATSTSVASPNIDDRGRIEGFPSQTRESCNFDHRIQAMFQNSLIAQVSDPRGRHVARECGGTRLRARRNDGERGRFFCR
jgi:hypothetical protein